MLGGNLGSFLYGDVSVMECLNTVFLNVNGLRRKIADCDFIKRISKYDLIFLNETWIFDKNKTNLDINGYTSEHIPGNKSKHTRKGRFSGGISFYYKNKLRNHVNIVETMQNGIMWVI